MPSTRRAAAASAYNKNKTTTATPSTADERRGTAHEPVFEMVVIGCGGGPLETDCSGCVGAGIADVRYLLKPYKSEWEDGMLALEGGWSSGFALLTTGSGIGALATLFKSYPADHMFPSIEFPETYSTPVLKAAFVFSYLT